MIDLDMFNNSLEAPRDCIALNEPDRYKPLLHAFFINNEVR